MILQNILIFVFNYQYIRLKIYFLIKFLMYINTEVFVGINNDKYFFKYVYKGPNLVAMELCKKKNEIKKYLKAR